MLTDKEKRELHLDTIVTHRQYVSEMCDKMGIHAQGEKHDLSKFSEDEFDIYRYADGGKSPHDIAREKLGYSPSWIYHKARNQHHWEYWTDFNSATPNDDGSFTIRCVAVKMPFEQVIEMFCDFVGAGKAYSKEKWTCSTPIDYWKANCEGQRAMHKDSQNLLVKLLTKLADINDIDKLAEWYISNKPVLQKEYN